MASSREKRHEKGHNAAHAHSRQRLRNLRGAGVQPLHRNPFHVRTAQGGKVMVRETDQSKWNARVDALKVQRAATKLAKLTTRRGTPPKKRVTLREAQRLAKELRDAKQGDK